MMWTYKVQCHAGSLAPQIAWHPYSRRMKMIKDPVVVQEVAEDEFNRFCEAMDIVNNTGAMTEEDEKSFKGPKETIIRAIMQGGLVVNDDGEPVYTPRNSPKVGALTFREPSGADYMAMDRKKDGQNIGKMWAMADSVTKSSPGTIANLRNRDLKVVQAVMQLFMG